MVSIIIHCPNQKKTERSSLQKFRDRHLIKERNYFSKKKENIKSANAHNTLIRSILS